MLAICWHANQLRSLLLYALATKASNIFFLSDYCFQTWFMATYSSLIMYFNSLYFLFCAAGYTRWEDFWSYYLLQIPFCRWSQCSGALDYVRLVTPSMCSIFTKLWMCSICTKLWSVMIWACPWLFETLTLIEGTVVFSGSLNLGEMPCWPLRGAAYFYYLVITITKCTIHVVSWTSGEYMSHIWIMKCVLTDISRK